MEPFAKEACEITSEVSFARKVCRNTIDAFDQAMAIQISVKISSWALAGMVTRGMMASADGANDDVSRKIILLD